MENVFIPPIMSTRSRPHLRHDLKVFLRHSIRQTAYAAPRTRRESTHDTKVDKSHTPILKY